MWRQIRAAWGQGGMHDWPSAWRRLVSGLVLAGLAVLPLLVLTLTGSSADMRLLSALCSLVVLLGIALAAQATALLLRQGHVLPDDGSDSTAEQDAIVRLLDEMSPLAEGDLAVRATVSEAMTGALADAFNHAVGELRRLVRSVQESSRDVNRAVHDSRQRIHAMATGGARQARQIQRSANYLNALSHTMAGLTDESENSAAAAAEAVQLIVAAGASVKANREMLGRVAQQAGRTMDSMQKLGDSAVAIQSSLGEIRQVARHTELLALNASLHTTAPAGDFDDGDEDMRIGSLADEVAELAATLARASRDIDALAGVVQHQVEETLHGLEATRGELLAAQHHADTVAVTLGSVDALGHELRALMQGIAEQTRQQSAVVQRLAGNMRIINELGQQHAHALHDAAGALDRQQQLASRLDASVQGFRLPGRAAREVNRQRPSPAALDAHDETAEFEALSDAPAGEWNHG